ncbi:amino acid ABC transporter substrate-binding protein [Aliidongia dinghuensis]|uniref:Amino acid ABC transporter substrate-binding protein n=1 Tax=Aliidongia dinghuensis TaxID=1867774 RepID=A0A8J2YPZ6_9PROT|nr:amino acid ABC transporter substrate-binding protein [Aliidongia dinghuensis]GGF02901.1 amino acid ABC transporter substrate-binding protein [Aliidongia dinghuensis]
MGKIVRVALWAGLAGGLMLGGALPARAGVTLDAVKQRGHVICGVNTGVAGFSLPDSKGDWKGLDIDLCKAIAAAVFLDPSKVQYVPTTAVQRFPAVQSGEVDVLTRNATQTLTREASLGLHMAGVNFYDGQGFMVSKKSGVKNIKQLNGATVCVQPGTTTELNMADYARSNHIELKPVVIERVDENISALSSGRCDAFTTDSSQLASLRVTAMPQPDDWVILPELISKEPLGPMVRNGDDQWLDIVKWTLTAMIQAEELGITQANLDEKAKSGNPEVQRFLGVTAGNGQALGLDEKWAYAIIKAVGNYGESFERNMGKGSPIKLDRGLNDLWTRGGLMYALPLR